MQLLIILTCGLFCLSAISAAEKSLEKMEKTVKKCMAESGVDPEVIERHNNGELVDDKKLHCFLACVLQEYGNMNEAGIIDPITMVNNYDDNRPNKETFRTIVETCTTEKGGNPCEVAAQFGKCFYGHKGSEEFVKFKV